MVNFERQGTSAILRLDRPEVGNALNDEVVAELDALLDRVRTDPEVRSVIVTGSGKIFSAGADLNWMKR